MSFHLHPSDASWMARCGIPRGKKSSVATMREHLELLRRAYATEVTKRGSSATTRGIALAASVMSRCGSCPGCGTVLSAESRFRELYSASVWYGLPTNFRSYHERLFPTYSTSVCCAVSLASLQPKRKRKREHTRTVLPRFQAPSAVKPAKAVPPPEPVDPAECDAPDEGDEHKPGVSYPHPNRRMVGVELEHNTSGGAKVTAFLRRWGGQYKADGSCGWELVTPPAAGPLAEDCIRDACDSVAGRGCNDSCATHIHVDATDLTWSDMSTLFALWFRVEREVFAAGCARRLSNTYCAPLGQQAMTVAAQLVADARLGKARCISFATSGTSTTTRGLSRHARGRYRAINVLPWLHGRAKGKGCTIEFRLWSGTTDPETIIRRAQLSEAIVSWSAMHSPSDAMAMPPGLPAIKEVSKPFPGLYEWVVDQCGNNVVFGQAVI